MLKICSELRFLPFQVKTPEDQEALEAMLRYDRPGLLLAPIGQRTTNLFPAYPFCDTTDVLARREREVLKYNPSETFSFCSSCTSA